MIMQPDMAKRYTFTDFHQTRSYTGPEVGIWEVSDPHFLERRFWTVRNRNDFYHFACNTTLRSFAGLSDGCVNIPSHVVGEVAGLDRYPNILRGSQAKL
jgi:hypothetical protein